MPPQSRSGALTFDEFRKANVTRCVKWHPAGIESWSPSDWLTAVTGELGELASLLKMRNRERDALPGNKFSPSDKQVADELADVLTYLDLLAAALGVDLGAAAVQKFNEVSERVGFPDRIAAASEKQACKATPSSYGGGAAQDQRWNCEECGDVTDTARCPKGRQNETLAALAAPSSASPSNSVLVPRELTAENGAKAALSGEFTFEPYLGHDGKTLVPWDMIKQIHRKVVELYGTPSATSPTKDA